MNWDYIIVGAGSAGCALVHELVQAGKNVLVLEAGGSDRSPFIRFPAGQIRAIGSRDWGYRSQPDPTRDGATEAWLRGRVLGGSSSINGTMYVRGRPGDFDAWGDGWSAPEVMPVFQEFENSDHLGSARGHDGPVHVRTVARPHALTRAFVASSQACGWAFNADYNGDSQEGVGYAQLTQRNGLRCSAADAFLKPLLGRDNVQLLLNASVDRLNVADGRVASVSVKHQGKMRLEFARQVIVCAGALASPQLLMLSGIGERAELERHGIKVAVDLPGVGRNLREHPLIRLTYRTKTASYNLTEGWLQKLSIAAQFIRYREGPVANLFEGVAFLKSAIAEPIPDIQLHFLPIGYLHTAEGGLRFTEFPAVSVLLNKSYPVSSGRIRLADADPGNAPLIESRLLESASDSDTLVRGIKVVRTIMQSQPIAGLIDREIEPGEDAHDDAGLQAYVRRRTGLAYHPIGTCRMGTDDLAVVRPDLRVYGIENLWVADASVIPQPISGNTNAACMMIGAKLGKRLAAGT